MARGQQGKAVFTGLEEDGVYLVRYLEIGTLEALELYNDSKEEVDIHRTET